MPLTPKGQKIMSHMKQEYGDKKGESVFYASRNKGRISGVDPESSHGHKHMPTGTPGHFAGGVKGGGEGQPGKPQYDTATQTFRKPAKKAAAPAPKGGGSKGGFAGKTSQVRPLTAQEHQQAADHLSAGGHHHAAAHHRAAAESMQGGGGAPSDNDGDEGPDAY